ncbi:regulatory protein GemA [Albimonas pacifica]|uniref:Mu-like prophage protein gp16 n=1 Tax=Albimonas pacifica TaxID=1114924 RepID=A0A1I3QHB6_9RHOB|nr:regulatory protein GemA [Albimonas pacifica]SFJ32922.1 Protein of unknown function [Albimonas pacifica]
MSAVKSIYAGVRALGIAEEDDRRALYERVTGKRRLREMTPSEKSAVVDELRRMGFRPAGGRRRLDGSYAPKLQALWIAAWNLGLVRSRDDAALLAFVKRQAGVDHTRFLHDAAAAASAIEGLKGWIARDGGVDWSDREDRPRWQRDHGAKIALAQWWRLPDVRAAAGQHFTAAVYEITGPKSGLHALHRLDWRAVNNAWGARIRAGAGAAQEA